MNLVPASFFSRAGGLAACSCLMLGLVSVLRGSVVVDDFGSVQPALTSGAAAQAGGMLGGERDLVVVDGAAARSAKVTNGVLTLSHDAGAGGSLRVVWDGAGDDAAVVGYTSLSPVNLTAGGDNAFFLGVVSAAAPANLSLTVHSDSTHASTVAFTVPAGSQVNYVRVPFSALTGGADLSQVVAVQLALAPGAAANTVTLDFLRTTSATDPTPLRARLTDLVLVDNDNNGRASPGDRLRYVVTVTNTSASDLASVRLTATPDANSTLVNGSLQVSPLAADDSYSTVENTALSIASSAAGLLANDRAGIPAATVASFGGGSLGGAITGHAAGATATIGGTGSLKVNADGTFDFTPDTGVTGDFTFLYRATNAAGSHDAAVTVSVGEAPTITSAASATFTVGAAGNFTVTTTGIPSGAAIDLSVTGTLPSGVSFTDNGDGTATLAGTPAATTGGTHTLSITAANGVPPNATQTFTLTVNEAPAITSANSTKFQPGQAASFTVTTSGFPTSSSMTLSVTGTLPSGVSFTDNDDGTATLGGTPALNAGGTYPLTINAGNGVTPDATQTFTLTVNSPPTGNADTDTVTEETDLTATGNVLTNDTDPDAGDTLSVSQVNGSAANVGVAVAGSYGEVNIASTGAYTYTLTNTDAAVQALTAGQSLSDAFTYIPSDGVLEGAAATLTITIHGTNDAPTLAGIEGTALSFNQNTAAAAITSSITIGDIDGPAISGATVTISSGYVSGQDTLSFTNQLGITGSFNVGTGTLTLSGTTSLANYQAALRAVQFRNTSGASSTTARTISFQVTDGAAGSNAVARNVTINLAPAVTTESYNAFGNTPLLVGVAQGSTAAAVVSGTLFDNDSDPENNVPLQLGTVDTTGTAGVVVVNSDGTFSFTPNAGVTGNTTFTYTVADSVGAVSAPVTVTIAIGTRVWYVDNSVVSGDGRAATPFSTLATAVAASAAGDVLFVNTGSADYAAGITLKANQQLAGRGAPLVVNSTTLLGAGVAPTLVAGSAPGVTLATAAGNVNTIRGLRIGSTSGAAIVGNGFGTLNVDTVAITNATNNRTGQILDLTTGVVAASFTHLSTTSAATGINFSGITGTLTAAAGAISGVSGVDVAIGNGTASFTYNGTITNTSDRSVTINGHTGGTVTFGGAINDTGTGIALTNNTGTTMAFTGGLTLSTGANAAFAATGGGTLTITGASNTLTTTTATALNVASTTIGSGGLTFRSISSSGGTAPGIILDTTGSLGGLTVTGDGSNTTKGGNASGGTIANKSDGGAHGVGTAGTGIYLNNTTGVVLQRMQLNDHGNFGIYGVSVNGFTLRYATISGANGNNDANDEGAIRFGKSNPSGLNGLVGGTTSLIDNVRISGGIEHNVQLYGQSGTFTLNVTNSDIKNNTTALGADGIQLELQGTVNGTVLVQNCIFDDNKSQAMQAAANDSSVLDLTITGSTVQKTSQGNEGFVLSNGSNGRLTARVLNNTITGIRGATIFVGQTANNASSTSNLVATIQGNAITQGSATQYSTNRAIIAFLTSTPGAHAPASIVIDNNTVAAFSDPLSGLGEPIFVGTPDSGTDPVFTAVVTNNQVTITDPGQTALRGIALQATQGPSTDDRSQGSFDVRNNTVTYLNGPPVGVNGLRVRQAGNAIVQLEQGSSSSSTASTVITANNPASTTDVVGTVTVVGNSTIP